jgi:pyruvate kinase
MPILTLVVPQLKSNGLSWRLTGRSTARQCLVERGLLPVLAAPSPSGQSLSLAPLPLLLLLLLRCT